MPCPTRPEPRLRRINGFAVAWMLVLVAVIALLGASGVQDVLFAQQLANTRAHQQRAMGMAQLGLRLGMRQLSDATAPQLESGELHPGPTQADSVQVTLRPGAERVPPGFSAGRFIAHDYEMESTGRSVRGTQRVLVQGVTRMEPLAPGAP
jgi:hypothetical protein